MKALRCAHLLALPLWVAVAAAGTLQTSYDVEVTQRVPLGVLPATGLYRYACCPNGWCAIVHSSGSVIVVDRQGTVRFRRNDMPELTWSTACTCDAGNRLWIGAPNVIKEFDFTPSGEPHLLRTFKAGGAIHRILVTDKEIYLLGEARVAGMDVLLRRFRKADGTFLGALPVQAGRRPWQTFAELGDLRARLLVSGSLVALDEGLLYIPQNPLEFRLYGNQGQLVDVRRPFVQHFRSVDLDHLASASGPGLLQELDWVMSALALPDRKLVVQMVTRVPSAWPEAPTEPQVYLAIFDRNLELLTEDVWLDPAVLPGVLAGVDETGELGFVEIVSGATSWLFKARLKER